MLNIMACTFIRERTSDIENGIIVNEGKGPIIDVEGLVVTKVHDWNSTPYKFCVSFNPEVQES